MADQQLQRVTSGGVKRPRSPEEEGKKEPHKRGAAAMKLGDRPHWTFDKTAKAWLEVTHDHDSNKFVFTRVTRDGRATLTTLRRGTQIAYTSEKPADSATGATPTLFPGHKEWWAKTHPAGAVKKKKPPAADGPAAKKPRSAEVSTAAAAVGGAASKPAAGVGKQPPSTSKTSVTKAASSKCPAAAEKHVKVRSGAATVSSLSPGNVHVDSHSAAHSAASPRQKKPTKSSDKPEKIAQEPVPSSSSETTIMLKVKLPKSRDASSVQEIEVEVDNLDARHRRAKATGVNFRNVDKKWQQCDVELPDLSQPDSEGMVNVLLTELDPKIRYSVRLKAKNAKGWSHWSNEFFAQSGISAKGATASARKLKPKPSKPEVIKEEEVTCDKFSERTRTVTLKVKLPKSRDTSAIGEMLAQISDANAEEQRWERYAVTHEDLSQHSSGDMVLMELTGLNPELGYSVRLRASNAKGPGQWSKVLFAGSKALRVGRKVCIPSQAKVQDVDAIPILKQHTFLDLAKSFCFENVRKLVEQDKHYVNVQGDPKTRRFTALHQACLKGDAETVDFLLKKGADPMLTDERRDATAKYITLFDGKRHFPEGSHSECAALIDIEMLRREFGEPFLVTLRRELEWFLCTKKDMENWTLKVLIAELEEKCGKPSGTFTVYKRGIKAEYFSAIHRSKPSKPTNVQELQWYEKQLHSSAKADNVSEMQRILLEMNKLLVTVRMISKSRNLVYKILRNGEIKMSSGSTTKSFPAEHKLAAQALFERWKNLCKTGPHKLSKPVLITRTDNSLTLQLTVPKTDENRTELTAIVVKYQEHGASTFEEMPIPEALWQGKVANEHFTWVLQSLRSGTPYDMQVYARGTEECIQQKGHAVKATFETLTVATPEELNSLSDTIKECLDEKPQNLSVLRDVLQQIYMKHVTIEALKTIKLIINQDPLNNATKVAGEVGETAKKVLTRWSDMFKPYPKVFDPIVVSKDEEFLELALKVPRSGGELGNLSAFEYRHKKSTSPWPRSSTGGWKMINQSEWREKPTGAEFKLKIEDLDPGTKYDISIRAQSDQSLKSSWKNVKSVETLIAHREITQPALKIVAEELRSLGLDKAVGQSEQAVVFDTKTQEILERNLKKLERSLIPIDMMKSSKIRKAVREVARHSKPAALASNDSGNFARSVHERATNLETYWKSTIKSAPRAPTVDDASFDDCTLKMTIAIPEAGTEITEYEVRWQLVDSDKPRQTISIPKSAWQLATEQFSWTVSDESFMPGAEIELMVRAHGSPEFCWQKQGSWSEQISVCRGDAMLVDDAEPFHETAVENIKDVSDACLENIRKLADALAGKETAASVISAIATEIDKQLKEFENLIPQNLWSVKLLKQTSLKTRLWRLTRIDLASQEQTELNELKLLQSRVLELDKYWKTLIKSPPEKIKAPPQIIDKTETSLTLTLNVPEASTPIVKYEVQIITLAEGAPKNPSRLIPEPEWSNKRAGDSVKWVIDGLDSGSKYAISVRAHGPEDECLQCAKHWSDPVETTTSHPTDEPKSNENVLGDNEEEEKQRQEAMCEDGSDDDDDQDSEVMPQIMGGNTPSPSSKASTFKHHLSKAFLGAANYMYKTYYEGKAEGQTEMSFCSAIRKAQLVQPINNEAKSPLPAEYVHVMQIAVLFEGSLFDGPATSAKLFLVYAEEHLTIPAVDDHLIKYCAEALQKQETTNTEVAQIKTVFEAARDLESPGRRHKTDKAVFTKRYIGILDHVDALFEQATDAFYATGGAMSDDPLHDDALFERCESNPKHCIAVVKKAHQLRLQLTRKLSASFPNLTKTFQSRILENVLAKARPAIALNIPLNPASDDKSIWLNKAITGCPSDWIAQHVVHAQSSVLQELTAEQKHAELKGSISQVFSNGDKDQMSKDEPEDSAAFELMAAKLIIKNKHISEGKSSKAWCELVTSTFHFSSWNGWIPGKAGFNEYAQQMMDSNNVPNTKRVSVPSGDKAYVQPYQQVVSYLVHPKSYTLNQSTDPSDHPSDPIPRIPQSDPSQRMLVVHRTGAGKTCTMIRIADNYFNDKRPKVLLFPSPAVCSNFYMELLNHRFPNRYAEYLQREKKLDAVRSGLELKRGGLMCGRVCQEFLDDPLRPSAPLRAFSYTQAGGRQTCGDRQRINAVFKCPDGYGGGWLFGPGEHNPEDGYEEYQSDGNPFSNKIVLMDEFHNLVNPSPEIRKSPRRTLMLQMLKEMLRTAKNSVIVGFTGTPLVGERGTAEPLLDIIKGKGNEHLSDEGFVSYFMGSPSPVFPIVVPPANAISDILIRKVQLENLSAKHGNLREYEKHRNDSNEKALQRCSVGQNFGRAGGTKIFNLLTGGEGKLLREVYEADQVSNCYGYCVDRVRGYASKLSAVCDDIDKYGGKTLVLVHSRHGFKLMLRLLDTRFPNEVLGYVGCNPSQVVRWDDDLKQLIGDKHDEKEKAKGNCGCNICLFNNQKANLQGEEHRIMVADAKFCSEGVSFFGVRQLALVDMPENAAQFVQRVGRAVRFNGHAGLLPAQCNVRVRLYCASLPAGAGSNDDDDDDSGDVSQTPSISADERQMQVLKDDLKKYDRELIKLQDSAVDYNRETKHPLWDESNSEADFETVKAALDKELQFEAEAKMKAQKIKAAKAKAKAAKAKAQSENAVKKQAANATTSYGKSLFKTYYDNIGKRSKAITMIELWESVEVLISHYEDFSVTPRFVDGLHKFVAKYCDENAVDEENVQDVSMLIWTSSSYGGAESEFCSLVNRALRDDRLCPEPILKHAALFSRALNKNLVTHLVSEGDRHQASGDATNYKCWPNGPSVTNKYKGWSSNKDATWRGCSMPRSNFQWWLDLAKNKDEQHRRFRTKMFVASSFSKNVAETFAERWYQRNDPETAGKVLFMFKFKRHKCFHVNYLDKTGFPSEKEFLLPPYTALELEKVTESTDVDARPHLIQLSVSVDNQHTKEWPLDLQLAGWI